MPPKKSPGKATKKKTDDTAAKETASAAETELMEKEMMLIELSTLKERLESSYVAGNASFDFALFRFSHI
jgi:5'-3' exonuclease